MYSIVALKASEANSGVFKVLDLGAGIGYSTLWMAFAMEYSCKSECILVAVERYRDRALVLRGNLESQGFSRVRIEVVEVDALEYLESLPAGSVDVAFVDISKSSYSRALAMLEDIVKPGGVVLVHNAYYPSMPPGLFERLEKGPWKYTVAPTPQGLVIATRSSRA